MIATTARRRRKVVIPTPPVTAQAQRAAERLKSANEPKPYTPSAEFQRAYRALKLVLWGQAGQPMRLGIPGTWSGGCP
jgi:hypothetical protein